MQNDTAYKQGFMDKYAEYGVDIKQAGTGRLAKNVLSLSDEALGRLSQAALAARKSGKVPTYALGGPGDSLFGVRWGDAGGVSAVQPSMKQELITKIRNALWSQRRDPLAEKIPGTNLLPRDERIRRGLQDFYYGGGKVPEGEGGQWFRGAEEYW